MERLKTAVYSFECPLQAGAVLAGASEDVVALLGLFGREVGIAYQIVDDLLGVFGDETETGKTTIGDLREGKRTTLIAHAATTPFWSELKPYIGKPDLSISEAAAAVALLEKAGSRAFTEALVADHAVRALQMLDDPRLPEGLCFELSSLADDVLRRVR